MEEELRELRTQLTEAQIDQATYNGKTNAWWEAQWGWNTRFTRDVEDIDTRLGTLEKKVIKFCGMAAGAGAVIGTVLPAIVKSLIGG